MLIESASRSDALQSRFCERCRQRRVRCDKQMPCLNCQRAAVPCTGPPPTRAPQLHSPDPNARGLKTVGNERVLDLTDRLRALEDKVESLRSQAQTKPSGKTSASTPPVIRAGSGPGTSTGFNDLGKLKPRKCTYQVHDAFWERLNSDIDALQDDDELGLEDDLELPTASQNLLRADYATARNHGSFIFGYSADDVDLSIFHPMASQAQILWSVYQENVEPLVKLLHVPTMNTTMQGAALASLLPDDEALVFAIYYSALIAMEEDEVRAQLCEDKDVLLKQFRFALEVSLARADLLSTSGLASLQALVLFLIAVRRVDDSLFCWTLTGLAVRIAQRMGLHRDGSNFNLTPYETELRRRVWWAILVLDQRSAEEACSDLIIMEDAFDTRMPSNINDADINPMTMEMPTPGEGRTETSLALARYEILALSRRFTTELASGDAGMNTAACERLLVEAYDHVEKTFLKRSLHQAEPSWWTASLLVRIIVSKMCLGLYESKVYQGAMPSSGSYVNDTIRDRVFVTAIEAVELGNLLYEDDRCKRYRWLFLTYTNWHAIALSFIEICRRPWSALVERSWESVQGFDKNPAALLKGSHQSAVFRPLRSLYQRARRHRRAELARLRADLEASRKLDLAERTSPASTHFSLIPGGEERMGNVRLKWRQMLL